MNKIRIKTNEIKSINNQKYFSAQLFQGYIFRDPSSLQNFKKRGSGNMQARHDSLSVFNKI